MDDTDRKYLAMLDSDFAGERTNAVELWREKLRKEGRTFRDISADIENAVPLHQHEDLQDRFNDYAQANTRLAQRCRMIEAQLTIFKATVSVRRYWRQAAAAVVVGTIAVVGWQYYQSSATASERETADAAFQKIALATKYEKTDKDSAPVVLDVAGAPYWAIVRRDEDPAEYRDQKGRPVMVQCVRIFAERAVREAGAYRKPRPYAFWGSGWLTWSQRAVDCRTDTMRIFQK